MLNFIIFKVLIWAYCYFWTNLERLCKRWGNNSQNCRGLSRNKRKTGIDVILGIWFEERVPNNGSTGVGRGKAVLTCGCVVLLSLPPFGFQEWVALWHWKWLLLPKYSESCSLTKTYLFACEKHASFIKGCRYNYTRLFAVLRPLHCTPN